MRGTVVPLLLRVIHADPCDGVVDAVFALVNALLYQGAAASQVLVDDHQTLESACVYCTAHECEEAGVPELLMRIVSSFERIRPTVVLHALHALSGYVNGRSLHSLLIPLSAQLEHFL